MAGIALRQTRELREIGPALLQKGVPALLALLGHVVEHRRVTRKLLDARKPIRISVEGRLQETDRDGTLLQNLPRPLYRLLLQSLHGDDGIDQAHLQRLLG